MTLKDFCSEQNYYLRSVHDEIPFRVWRAEKVNRMIGDAGEEAENRAIKVRSKLIHEQLNALEQIPSVLSRLLRVYDYAMKQHENDARADMDDRLKYENKMPEKWKPKFNLDSNEIMQLSTAGRNLQDALHKALLIKHDDTSPGVVLLERVKSEAEAQVARSGTGESRQVNVIGLGLAEPAKLQEVLSGFFDRPSKSITVQQEPAEIQQEDQQSQQDPEVLPPEEVSIDGTDSA